MEQPEKGREVVIIVMSKRCLDGALIGKIQRDMGQLQLRGIH